MTPDQFARRIQAFPARLTAEVVACETLTARAAKSVAVRLSSGTQTTAQLRKAGHPYARRAPNSAFDPTVINSQTGIFRAGWKTQGPTVTAGGVVTRLYNTSSVAKYMLGTRLMISRDQRDAIRKAVEPARQRRLRAAVGKAWRGQS